MSEDTKKEVQSEMRFEDKPKSETKKKAAFKAAPKKKVAAKQPPSKPVKRYTFEQWAARRGVKNHHRGGLRAFIKNSTKPRSLKDWDSGFEGY